MATTTLAEGTAIAERVTAALDMDGMRVEYFPGAHGGYSVHAGPAAWKIAETDASGDEVEAEARALIEARDPREIAFWTGATR